MLKNLNVIYKWTEENLIEFNEENYEQISQEVINSI